jgi:hypothetical protein
VHINWRWGYDPVADTGVDSGSPWWIDASKERKFPSSSDSGTLWFNPWYGVWVNTSWVYLDDDSTIWETADGRYQWMDTGQVDNAVAGAFQFKVVVYQSNGGISESSTVTKVYNPIHWGYGDPDWLDSDLGGRRDPNFETTGTNPQDTGYGHFGADRQGRDHAGVDIATEDDDKNGVTQWGFIPVVAVDAGGPVQAHWQADGAGCWVEIGVEGGVLENHTDDQWRSRRLFHRYFHLAMLPSYGDPWDIAPEDSAEECQDTLDWILEKTFYLNYEYRWRRAGQIVGFVGRTGNLAARYKTHLHFEILDEAGSVKYDPEEFIIPFRTYPLCGRLTGLGYPCSQCPTVSDSTERCNINSSFSQCP